jgi:hypothetical protein
MIAPELMNVQPQSMFQKVYAYSSSFKCTFITTIVLLGVAAVLAIVLSTINCSWYYYSEAIFACIFLFFFNSRSGLRHSSRDHILQRHQSDQQY